MGSEARLVSPRNPKNALGESTTTITTTTTTNAVFSPRFKSVAAMAGWDEETLLSASLIVDDTPDRIFKHKKRSDLQSKTSPASTSRRKRRVPSSPVSIPMVTLNLDDEEIKKDETKKDHSEQKASVAEEKGKTGEAISVEQNSGVVGASSSGLPCMDKLREELSCAICLDICFEPTTTPCGHSNGRSCTVNTVLWNTIQLLFPQEVAARKEAGALNIRESERRVTESTFYNSLRSESPQDSPLTTRAETARGRRTRQAQIEISATLSSGGDGVTSNRATRVSTRDRSTRSSSRGIPSQDEDAALALRLQREEFLGVVRGTINHSSTFSSISLARPNQPSTISNSSLARPNQSSVTSSSLSSARENQSSTNSFSLARANLRAMASRAITLRVRGRQNS
ncbi:hypothetical protein CsatA_017335 [Cannabis sativa]